MMRRDLARLFAFAAPASATVAVRRAQSASLAPPSPEAIAASSQPNLKHQPPALQVRGILLSGDIYRVLTADGQTRSFREQDLGFKTDQGVRGPQSGTPIILPAGMKNGRALVIFSEPQEITETIKRVS
jgi:hypothetical protein